MTGVAGLLGPPVDLALTVKVRRCGELDLAALEWYGMFATHRQIIRDAFRRQQAGEVEMLVGEVGGTPVAQVWIDIARRRREGVGVFWALRVFPILRGLGIGTELLTRGEGRLRQRGFVMAEIGVEKDNPRAQRLYERLGYRVMSSIREPYRYRLADGTLVEAIADQRLLRKPL